MDSAHQDPGLKFCSLLLREGRERSNVKKEEDRDREGWSGKRCGTKMRKVNDIKSVRDSLFLGYLHS